MRNLWAGLVTNASPYVIPHGAAVEQTNLVGYVPGQLVSRGGMRPVDFSAAAPEIRDIYPYVFSNAVQALVLTSSGTIESLSTPATGTSLAAPDPVEPALSPSSGQSVSNYCGTFYAYGEEAPT